MTEPATDKQVYFLKSRGIDPTNMDKMTAIKLIEGLKANSQSTIVQVPPVEQVVSQGYTKPYAAKKPYSPSSYYVSYSKDLFVALIALDKYKNVDPEIVMDMATLCIKKAIEELK